MKVDLRHLVVALLAQLQVQQSTALRSAHDDHRKYGPTEYKGFGPGHTQYFDAAVDKSNGYGYSDKAHEKKYDSGYDRKSSSKKTYGHDSKTYGYDDYGHGRDSKTYGYDDYGYGRDSKTYGYDDYGYGRDSKTYGYGDSSKGYGSGSTYGYGDSSKGYGSGSTYGYGDSSKGYGSGSTYGYGDSSTGYGSGSTYGYGDSSTGYGSGSTYGYGDSSTGYGSGSTYGYGDSSTGYGSDSKSYGSGSGSYGSKYVLGSHKSYGPKYVAHSPYGHRTYGSGSSYGSKTYGSNSYGGKTYGRGSYGKKHKVYHDVSDDWPYYQPPPTPSMDPPGDITPVAPPAPAPVPAPIPGDIVPVTCNIPVASENDPNLSDNLVECNNAGFTAAQWSWLRLPVPGENQQNRFKVGADLMFNGSYAYVDVAFNRNGLKINMRVDNDNQGTLFADEVQLYTNVPNPTGVNNNKDFNVDAHLERSLGRIDQFGTMLDDTDCCVQPIPTITGEFYSRAVYLDNRTGTPSPVCQETICWYFV